MRRILLALLLVALAVSTADARRRHHGFYGYGNDGDRSERYGERSERYGERGEQYRARSERSDDRSQRYGDQGERYGRGEPAFGERYGRDRRDRYGREYGRNSNRFDATTGFGGVDRYGPARRGVEALVPADWQLQPADPRWTGRRFLSPDGNAWMALYSVSADKEPREEHVKKVAFGEGEELTYLRREADWLVVSGLKNDRVFYRKVVLACGGQAWRHVAFEYPAEQKRAFDGLVTRAARALDQDDGADCVTAARAPVVEPPASAPAQPPAAADNADKP